MELGGVDAAYVTDNGTSNSTSVNEDTIKQHSLDVCVDGGSDLDVAVAIMRKKPPGCGYTGTTTVTVTDSDVPYPSLPAAAVSFTRAQKIPIYFSVSIKAVATPPADAQSQIVSAIVSMFNKDKTGNAVSGTVYSSNYFAPVLSIGSWVHLLGVTVGISANPSGVNISSNIDQVFTLSPSDVSVSVS